MLTQDTALQIAYAERPDMLLRLAEFVVSYALHDRPTLIAQASTDSRGLEVDLADEARQAALRTGSGRQVAWWDAFHAAGGLHPVFRGLACLDSRDEPQWAFEMHRDGSLIAGVWAFPECGHGSSKQQLTDFYAGFFEDFAEKALRLTADLPKPYRFTATLLRASSLQFAAAGYSGWFHAPPSPRLETLQWPLRLTSTPDTWQIAAARMNTELFGAYGHTFRVSSP
ncbi:hypothetical protein [Cupriavidus malaysiensis]|uniref:GNAT family N-acetyltransferase n=1 Tax=Cupriavidus malaysiensis TaxID=367825 RepID=A0A1D9I301_9BURK|nr:hypothetical protein [Cupriavidus malaysiensis]AOZ06460.1 hypothetical protein BKK80_11995 [Cupriavidus malaysiensis]